MKKKFSVLCLFALLVAAMTVFAPSASAAKVTAVKTATKWKKAKAVKVNKNYIVHGKNKNSAFGSYLKFKAKKKGTYRFSFSNFTVGDGNNRFGELYNICICKPGKGSWEPASLKVKTEGGKSNVLSCCDGVWDKQINTEPKPVTTVSDLPARTAQLKLKKNQTVYIKVYQTSTDAYTFNLQIKKVK